MRMITALVILVAVSSSPAIAEVFDIPATGIWVKAQVGEVTQWSAIPSTRPKTRIDLISYIEDGKQITYYLIRSACLDGTVTSSVIKPGNQVGVGTDCNGYVATETATLLNEVRPLPPEAAALLRH